MPVQSHYFLAQHSLAALRLKDRFFPWRAKKQRTKSQQGCNQIAYGVCRTEMMLMKLNRLAGLSVVMLAHKPGDRVSSAMSLSARLVRFGVTGVGVTAIHPDCGDACRTVACRPTIGKWRGLCLVRVHLIPCQRTLHLQSASSGGAFIHFWLVTILCGGLSAIIFIRRSSASGLPIGHSDGGRDRADPVLHSPQFLEFQAALTGVRSYGCHLCILSGDGVSPHSGQYGAEHRKEGAPATMFSLSRSLTPLPISCHMP